MQRDDDKLCGTENVISFEKITHSQELYSVTKNGTLKKYKGSEQVVTIPEGVTRIGESAFESNTFIEKVILSETVEVIEKSAFAHCKHLKSVIFPSRLKQIETYTFNYCEELEDIFLPDSLTDIGAFAFSHCSKLRAIRIPKNVREIPCQLLSECPELHEVYIDKNVENIDDRAFLGSGPYITVAEENSWFYSKEGSLYTKDMRTLKKGKVTNDTYVFPEGVKIIAPNAFYGNKALCDIFIPASVEEIGGGAFSRSGLEFVQFDKEGRYSLGYDLFSRCSSLETVLLPNGLAEIPSGTFCYCNNLKEIQLCEGLQKIGGDAFHGTNLKKVRIPGSVTEIHPSSFDLSTEIKQFSDLPLVRQIAKRNRAYYLCDAKSDGEALFEEDKVETLAVTDMVFVVCGPRGERKKIIEEEIRQFGGRCDSQVTQDTDYVVVEPGKKLPVAYYKALELRFKEKNTKLQILSVQSFYELMDKPEGDGQDRPKLSELVNEYRLLMDIVNGKSEKHVNEKKQKEADQQIGFKNTALQQANTSVRYGYRIRPRKEETFSPSIFDSKCGGQPYWDRTRRFPKDSEGNELALLAQINLDKLEKNTFGLLPQKGMLQFFISENPALYEDSYKVIYHGAIDYSYKPEVFCPELEDIFLLGEFAIELQYVEDTYRTDDYYDGSWLLRYKGATLNYHPVYDDVKNAKKYNQLLFQLDSMDVLYHGCRRTAILIGDWGFMSFHINASALRNRDFSDVFIHTDGA